MSSTTFASFRAVRNLLSMTRVRINAKRNITGHCFCRGCTGHVLSAGAPSCPKCRRRLQVQTDPWNNFLGQYPDGQPLYITMVDSPPSNPSLDPGEATALRSYAQDLQTRVETALNGNAMDELRLMSSYNTESASTVRPTASNSNDAMLTLILVAEHHSMRGCGNFHAMYHAHFCKTRGAKP